VSVAEKIMVSETELYSLLSNVLDNAREACMDLEEKEKEIVVRITQNKGYLFIHTENSFQKDGEKEDILELQTTKANKRAHGYGTKIIRMIVERYQGYVHYDVKGDRFITDVMIAIAKEA